ncbi:hypothetical protein EVG20_g159 [Dentipellis fragilis]|uniref:Uncharacterized protein n=1 Tax=Dentipellis fragilis TaxID=205917 RepID=A0A4Y9ZDM0_9AGAM|nr:hypothetical protein EVG20_g159 [Dentipellis fragilis]
MPHTQENHPFDLPSLLSGSPTLHYDAGQPMAHAPDSVAGYQDGKQVAYDDLSYGWSSGTVAQSSVSLQGHLAPAVGPQVTSGTNAIGHHQQSMSAVATGPPSMSQYEHAARYPSGRLHVPFDPLSQPGAPSAQRCMDMDGFGGRVSSGEPSHVVQIPARQVSGRRTVELSSRHPRKRTAEEVDPSTDSDEEEVPEKRLKSDNLDLTNEAPKGDNRVRQRVSRKEKTDGANRLRGAIPEEHFRRYSYSKDFGELTSALAADYIVQVQARMEELRRNQEYLEELCLAMAKDSGNRRGMHQEIRHDLSQEKEGEVRDGSESTFQGKTASHVANPPPEHNA